MGISAKTFADSIPTIFSNKLSISERHDFIIFTSILCSIYVMVKMVELG